MPDLSVVIAVYGCEGALRQLHERLTATLTALVKDYEIVFVDDRSPDDAWSTLLDLAKNDHRVRAFRLSRNFGQHAAITAGLAQARGDRVVVMDGDLEEPPEAIPMLWNKANEGFEVVHTERLEAHHGIVRRMLGAVYFGLRNRLTRTTTGKHHGTLSLLSRKAVDAFLLVPDTHREYLALVTWLGYDSAIVAFTPEPRPVGRSAYTLGGMVRLAVDGMFFHTTVLLTWIVYLGFIVAAGGLLLAAYMIYTYIVDQPLPGYTSIAVLLLFLGAFILVSLGVVGLYVGKVFEQVKGRPLFVIDARIEDGGLAGPAVSEDEPVLVHDAR